MTLNRICEIVCKDYDIPVESLNLPDHKSYHVEPCQIAHFFAYILTTITEAKIGESIGNKDHATVLHSVKTVINAFGNNRVYRSTIRNIGKELMIEASRIHTPKPSMNSYEERKEMILNN